KSTTTPRPGSGATSRPSPEGCAAPALAQARSVSAPPARVAARIGILGTQRSGHDVQRQQCTQHVAGDTEMAHRAKRMAAAVNRPLTNRARPPAAEERGGARAGVESGTAKFEITRLLR